MSGSDGMHHGVQLVFDTNILVDAMAARGEYASSGVELLDMVRNGAVEGWYAPHTVTTVYYLLERTLRRDAEYRWQAVQAAKALLKETLSFLQPLPQVGDEMLTLETEPSDDLEDALIIHLAKEFLPNPLFVTRDKWFLTSGTHLAAHPKEIITRGLDTWMAQDTEVPFIDLKTQQRVIRQRLGKNIHNVLNHGRYILGPEVGELEQRLCDYSGAKHCTCVSSGTDALLMALMAWNIGPGDAVFTTPFTFIATAEVISLLGAIPVFVDIDPRTFNIDPKKLATAIQAVRANDPTLHPLPKASDTTGQLTARVVITVDLFGLPADYEPIMALAEKHGLKVLSDSAQGFGSEYKGKKSGTLGHATATSFFPAKPLGCYGDGGALLTDDGQFADICQSIRVHGKGKDKYDNIRIGLNARLHTLQAAILLAKLDIFDKELEAKRQLAFRYTELLAESNLNLVPPLVPEGLKSAWAQYSVLAADTATRNIIQASLKDAGIPSMVYYPKPLHMQTAFAGLGYRAEDFPVSVVTSETIFSLPMHGYMKTGWQAVHSIINSDLTTSRMAK